MIDGLITCRELIEFLADYIGDELSAQHREMFEKHLAVCLECRNYVDSYKTTLSVGKAAFNHPDDPIPDDVPESLIKALLAMRDADPGR